MKAALFRRTKPENRSSGATAASLSKAAPAEVRTGGKGRPTPTRREAEAASRARARGAKSRKEAAKLARAARARDNERARQALKSGEERYLPTRDRGPARRLARDVVDSRLSVAEFLLPVLLVIMALQYTPSEDLRRFSSGLWSALILLLAVDTTFLVWKLRRELSRRLSEGHTTKGAVLYGVLRSLQMRFLRLPKPQLKVGRSLAEKY